MAGIIEIRDQNDKGFLTVEFRDLLPLFEPEGSLLTWSILDLEAVGNPEKLKRSILEIEKEARQSACGLVLNWEELKELADSLTDVLDAVIVGCRNRALIPRLIAGPEMYDSCEIGIELIDSSLWRVYARDDALAQRVRTKFHEVTVHSRNTSAGRG